MRLAFGVHSAMSSKNMSAVPKLSLSGNYEKYKTVGLEIRAILKRYTDLIEPEYRRGILRCDGNKLGIRSAVKIAASSNKISGRGYLTASAGVSLTNS